MRKDIFIDNNVTKHFKNPMTLEYSDLYNWLITNVKEDPKRNAFIVITQKLLNEYNRSNQNAYLAPNIIYIIDLLQKQGRWNHIKNNEIKAFRDKNYTNKNLKKILSTNDLDHIPAILISDRKMALSEDVNLLHDIKNFPGFHEVCGEDSPEKIPYSR